MACESPGIDRNAVDQIQGFISDFPQFPHRHRVLLAVVRVSNVLAVYRLGAHRVLLQERCQN